MSKIYEQIDEKLSAWIVQQRMFFVATAPRSDEGHVNVSPKGPIESLRIVGPRRVAYLDLIGSGAESVAHVRENGRIVLMLCAFDGPPRIVRLHGRGHVVQTGEQEFDRLTSDLGFSRVAAHDGARAIVTIDVERVSDSCGMGVPLMEYQSERSQYPAWIQSQQKKGDNALLDRVAEWNVTSIDGLPAFDPTLLPWHRSQPEVGNISLTGDGTMTTVSSLRVRELATRFEQTADELASLVETLTPEEWSQRGQNSPIWSLGADEERPVGVIAYHAASVIGIHTGMLREALAGRPMLGDGHWDVEGVAAWNASVAQDKAGVSSIDVLSELRTNTATALELLGSLTDMAMDTPAADVDRAAVGPFHPALQTLMQFVNDGLIGHLRVHRESLRATVGR